MIDQESRKTWRTNWLESLYFFSNLNFQETLWSGKIKSAIDCYTEAVSDYFDQLNLQDNYEWALQEELLSKIEFDIVKKFHDNLLDYAPPKNDLWNYRAILNDSKWKIVCDSAREALSNLINLNGFFLVSQNNKFLDFNEENHAKNSSVILNPIKGTQSQLWRWSNDCLIVSVLNPNKCLEYNPHSEGCNSVFLSAIKNSLSQKWVFTLKGHIISLLDRDKSLDFEKKSSNESNTIVLSNISPDTGIRWSILPGFRIHSLTDNIDVELTEGILDEIIIAPTLFEISGGITCTYGVNTDPFGLGQEYAWTCRYNPIPPGSTGEVGSPIKIDDTLLAEKVIDNFKLPSIDQAEIKKTVKIFDFSIPTRSQTPQIVFSLNKTPVIGRGRFVAERFLEEGAKSGIENSGL
jgi:Ricin-type beta-trefoil lectin domain